MAQEHFEVLLTTCQTDKTDVVSLTLEYFFLARLSILRDLAVSDMNSTKIYSERCFLYFLKSFFFSSTWAHSEDFRDMDDQWISVSIAEINSRL